MNLHHDELVLDSTHHACMEAGMHAKDDQSIDRPCMHACIADVVVVVYYMYVRVCRIIIQS